MQGNQDSEEKEIRVFVSSTLWIEMMKGIT